LAEPRLRAAPFGLGDTDIGDTLAHRSPPSQEILRGFLRTLGIRVSERAVHEAALAATARYYVLALVRETLDALRGRGLRLGAVSRWDHGLIGRCGERGRSEHFGSVFCSALGPPRPGTSATSTRPTSSTRGRRAWRRCSSTATV